MEGEAPVPGHDGDKRHQLGASSDELRMKYDTSGRRSNENYYYPTQDNNVHLYLRDAVMLDYTLRTKSLRAESLIMLLVVQ